MPNSRPPILYGHLALVIFLFGLSIMTVSPFSHSKNPMISPKPSTSPTPKAINNDRSPGLLPVPYSYVLYGGETKPLVDSIRHFIRDPSGVFSVCHLCECRIIQWRHDSRLLLLLNWFLHIIKRTLHVGSKIWISCSRGKNNISRVSAANEWDIVLATWT